MGVYAGGVKRCLDLAFAGSAIVLLLPLLAGIAVAIRLQDGGPAVFRQLRVGRYSRQFTLYKFRSMPVNVPNLPSASAGTLSVTRVGRFIRRTNLDELPQLFNVLRGQMSLIGPRPALPGQTELMRLRSGTVVMNARPGLTGLAQVNAFDGMTDAKKVEWELQYVEHITLLGDAAIFLRTFVYLLRPPPVY